MKDIKFNTTYPNVSLFPGPAGAAMLTLNAMVIVDINVLVLFVNINPLFCVNLIIYDLNNFTQEIMFHT